MVPSKVVKAKVKLPADRKTKQDKELEAGMAAALEKEDFYGKKKLQERMNRDAQEAINRNHYKSNKHAHELRRGQNCRQRRP